MSVFHMHIMQITRWQTSLGVRETFPSDKEGASVDGKPLMMPKCEGPDVSVYTAHLRRILFTSTCGRKHPCMHHTRKGAQTHKDAQLHKLDRHAKT